MERTKPSSATGRQKLWQKNSSTGLDPIIEEFNAGDDIVYDQELVPYDVQGSLGYAKMLERHGVLTAEELAVLEKGLNEILELYKKGEFVLKLEDEDCHTAIEHYLVSTCGEVGKKIHTARSRNDQILVTMRLFMKDKLNDLKESARVLTRTILETAIKYEFVPMPGYTHMQKAMPTTIGTWYGAIAESLLDDISLLSAVNDRLVDQNPLGSGAGFGSPFDFDRDKLSADLGFARTQNNVIYCQNSRGKIEGMVIEACSQLMMTLNKLASDWMLFTTQEYGFFTITNDVSTGSSIMPQKKNLDVAELIRGRTATVLSAKNEIMMNIMNKPSGYHRDGQEIKRPLFLGLRYTKMSLDAANIVVKSLIPNEDVLLADLTSELFAAHKAFELVREKGYSFRDAYVEVGQNLDKIVVDKDSIVGMLKESRHQGGSGNLRLKELLGQL